MSSESILLNWVYMLWNPPYKILLNGFSGYLPGILDVKLLDEVFKVNNTFKS